MTDAHRRPPVERVAPTLRDAPSCPRRTSRVAPAALCLAAFLGLAGTVSSGRAQEEGSPVGATTGEEPEDAASSRAAAFRAVEGKAQENVPGGPLLLSAYAVAWLLVFGYLLRLARLQRQNAADLDRLMRAVGQARGGGEAASGEGGR